MQIQLKQVEIVEALKQYIAKKGIDLTNKVVVIDFTSGRKDKGLSADLSIEDAEVVLDTIAAPAVDTPKAVLTVVASPPPTMAEPMLDVGPPPAVVAVKTGTSSLFS